MKPQKKTVNSLADKVEEFQKDGYCILKEQFATSLIDNCRAAFSPIFKTYLDSNEHLPNRGTKRYYLPMPFEPPCFALEFFFDPEILAIVKRLMGDRIIVDQWGCDVP